MLELIPKEDWLDIHDLMVKGIKYDELRAKQGISEPLVVNIHECINDLMEVAERRLNHGTAHIDKGSLRFEYKRVLDKFITDAKN